MRSRVELVLRAVAVAALASLFVTAGRRVADGGQRAASAELPAALRRWSTSASPARVFVTLGRHEGPERTAWLAALRDAGTAVGWRAPQAVPLALAADAVADPAGATRALVAAPAGTWVRLGDRWGVLDSVQARDGGARFLVASAPRLVSAGAGSLTAWSSVPDSLALGRVLVLGHAGWETKFVAAALEERGWRADVDMALSPRSDVTQGRPLPDTATHAAVVVLDSSAADRAGAVARFVAQGGGLVVASAALAVPAFASLAAAAAAEAEPAIEPYDTSFGDPRRSLAVTPIRARPDAIAIEQRAAHTAVAARRSGQGRVALLGYQDTWRWRLAGAGDAVEEHRAWWAGLVAAVAYARPVALPAARPGDEAPLASLVSQLGEQQRTPLDVEPAPDWQPLLLALLLAGLLGEWLSRRIRGKP